MNPSTLLYINTLYFPKAVLLSFLSFLLAAMFSSPLFLLTKLDVQHHLLLDRVTSYCYEEQGVYLEKVKVRTCCVRRLAQLTKKEVSFSAT